MSATLLCVLNEIANRLTRDSSVQRFVGPEPFLGVSRQNIGRKIKCWIENQHLVLLCGPCCTQRQAWEFISSPDLATRAQLLSSNRSRSRVVIGLLTGHNTLRRHLYIMGLRPLTCWDCGFESHRGHGYLSVVSVVCCQVEVSATRWSLVQRIPTDCGASCVI